MKNLIIGLHMAARGGKGALEQIVAAEQAGIDVAWMTCGGVAPDKMRGRMRVEQACGIFA